VEGQLLLSLKGAGACQMGKQLIAGDDTLDLHNILYSYRTIYCVAITASISSGTTSALTLIVAKTTGSPVSSFFQ
jgi:hypothetical protein